MSDDKEEQSIAITDFAPATRRRLSPSAVRSSMKRVGQPSSWIQRSPPVSIARETCSWWRNARSDRRLRRAERALSRRCALDQILRGLISPGQRAGGEAVRCAVRARPRAGLHHDRARCESGERPRHAVLPEARHGGVHPRASPPLAGIGSRGASVREIFSEERERRVTGEQLSFSRRLTSRLLDLPRLVNP